MRVKEYGRNHKKRKAYIHLIGLLMRNECEKAKYRASVKALEGTG